MVREAGGGLGIRENTQGSSAIMLLNLSELMHTSGSKTFASRFIKIGV